ncbi:MAG TPA: hypothetical protein VJ904_01210, partial [Tichowtungia sp.]|nr:hypothetical protein [Tichowtungia sp.]
WQDPQPIRTVRIVFDSDLTLDKRMLCRYPKDQPPASMPAMLARDFDMECCDENGNWSTACEIRDNIKRLVQLNFSAPAVTGCRLRILRSWGDQDAHVMAFDVSETNAPSATHDVQIDNKPK